MRTERETSRVTEEESVCGGSMRPIEYVVTRVRMNRREYLDTTEPDTWTEDKRKALASADLNYIKKLATFRFADVEKRIGN